jgi:hypothetical protein
MPCVVTQPAPGRLQIREGGGALTLFGLPFFAVGVFLLLSTAGLVTVHSDDPTSTPAMVLLGTMFTIVGGVLSFGRSVTMLDLAQHVVVQQWRLLLPIRSWTHQLTDYSAVTIGLIRGDSESAERYPIGLKAASAPPLVLCRPTQYAEARECAAAVARHLSLDIEDSSTDHPARMPASQADATLQQRLRAVPREQAPPARPPDIQSDVFDADGGVRIVIPMPRLNPFAAVAILFPAAIAAAMLGWLGFFSTTRALTAGEWIFFGVLFAGFGMLPAASFVSRWLGSRVGRTIVTVSTDELRVEQRGIARTRTVAVFNASEILDVDFSTKESALASARRHAEAEAATMRNGPATSPAASPAAERVFTVLSAFVKGQGIIVKTRKGLTTFGEGLPDDEIRYLHAVIERALAGGKA